MDAFLQSRALPGAMILKTDTEGNELNVLRGAQKSLEAGLIHSILVEASPQPRSKRHVSLQVLMELLAPLGFDLYGLYDLWYAKDGSMNFVNALFILRDESRA